MEKFVKGQNMDSESNRRLDPGIPSGIRPLDTMINHFQNSELILITGTKFSGRWTFLIRSALKASIDSGKKVGLISLDRSYGAINEFANKHNLENPNIVINDSPYIGIVDVLDICKDLGTEGVKMIYLDDIQLIQKNSQDINIKDTIRLLRVAATLMKIPIIISFEIDIDKKENLIDLDPDEGIMRFMDKVILLYRPEIYGEQKDEFGNDNTNKIWIKVIKNRNGKTGEALMIFNPESATFEEVS